MGLCGMKNRFQYGELLEKEKAGGAYDVFMKALEDKDA